MPLHPEVAKIIAEAEAADLPKPNDLPPPLAREQMRRLSPPLDLDYSAKKLVDKSILGSRGDIPVRLYYPEGEGPFPIVVYYHGGGWVLGDLETHNALCNAIAHITESLVVAVDYRLAPEHVYPAACEDCYEATVWVSENAEEINGDPNKLVVCGDSAGGNLAAVVSLMARDRKGPEIQLQVLVYPITDCDFELQSYIDNKEGYLLTRDLMIWFWELYTPGLKQAKEPYASPLRAEDLSGLPPAIVLTAEYDPLCTEGELYAKALEDAGNEVELTRYEGHVHGFFRMTSRLEESYQAIRQVRDAMRKVGA